MSYTLTRVVLFITIFFSCVSSKAQTNTDDESDPYDYDTTLKNGYTIAYKTDDSLQYLFLKKGPITIAEIASTSKGMLHKSLGYLGADFKDYFILLHSFGSGNPNYIQLIKKATGTNILKEGAAWIDVIEQKEILLYCNNDVPKKRDKMILYNIRTGQKQFFAFPEDIFAEPQILNRIKILKLSVTHLIITYETENGVRKTTYIR